MLQGPAAYFSSPVYGQSHYKKFWLKKMETEDDPASMSPPSSDGGSVVLNRPPYAVNCSPLELRGTSPPSAAVRAVKSAERKVKCSQKSELDYALALGAGVSMQQDVETPEIWEEKFVAPALNSVVAQPSSSAGFDGTVNGNGGSPSSSPSPRGGAVTRMCADCKTVKTPLWRNGPQGPKSLCNACGIRYKKMGKRPLMNPSPPSTPPISPAVKSVAKLNGKRKRETDGVKSRKTAHDQQHHHRKKMKALGGLERFRGTRTSMGPGALDSSSRLEVESREFSGEDRSGAAMRRWREVERIRKGLLRYGKMRSMAKDEEEAAVLLMAMASCC